MLLLVSSTPKCAIGPHGIMTNFGSITRSAVKGVTWTSVSQFGRQGLQLLSTAILARLLAPQDFGVMSMALVVVGFATLFKDLGTGSAVIQRAGVSPRLLSSIFWVNLAFGVLTMAGLCLLSPLAASFYQEARVTPLLQVLSLSFLVSGLGVLHQALLEKQLAFAKLAKIELSAMVLGAGVGISLALGGAGVWSLVYQTLTVTTTTTLFLWFASHWRPQLAFDLTELRSIWGYSLNLTGFNVFNYFVRNADTLLIGRFLGAESLGYYTLAYRLMHYPLQSISAVVSRVMFPIYSQIQDDAARFRATYLSVVRSIAFVSFPLMIGLFAIAEPLVEWAFGPNWAPVIPLLLILAPVGMGQSIGTTVGSIYQAKGRTDWMFQWGIASSAITLIGFAIGLRGGIQGVAVAYAVVSLLVLSYPSFAIPFKLIDLRMGELVRAVWRPFLCGLVMLSGLWGMRVFLSLGAGTQLCLFIPAGILFYIAASYWFNRPQLQHISRFVRRVSAPGRSQSPAM